MLFIQHLKAASIYFDIPIFIIRHFLPIVNHNYEIILSYNRSKGQRKMDVLNRINELRNERNWTMYKLAKTTDIPQSTISTWYQKNLLPPIDKLERICDAFGISLAFFFSNETTTELTAQQQEILSTWSSLTPDQRQSILNLISAFHDK